MERQSTGLSSHNIKEVPGEKVAEESLVRRGLWGRPEYITVISGTVPQTHGAEKVVQSEGHTQNTTDSAQLQSVLAVAVYDVGGLITCTCLDGRAVKWAGGRYGDKCDLAGESIHFVARCGE